MATLLALAALSAVSLIAVRLHRRERALLAELADYGERMKELSLRVEAAEADVAHAVTQADIAECLLVEKGVADLEDVEAMRRRYHADAAGGHVPSRDGDLN